MEANEELKGLREKYKRSRSKAKKNEIKRLYVDAMESLVGNPELYRKLLKAVLTQGDGCSTRGLPELLSEEQIRGINKVLNDAITDVQGRTILRLRYGLIDGSPWRLESVAREYGISKEDVRGYESTALDSLKRSAAVLESIVYAAKSR